MWRIYSNPDPHGATLVLKQNPEWDIVVDGGHEIGQFELLKSFVLELPLSEV
jgi:hypothetical protein